jgi:hypothetical protein
MIGTYKPTDTNPVWVYFSAGGALYLESVPEWFLRGVIGAEVCYAAA